MKNVVQFLNDVKLELSRVIWPKRDEFIGSTIVVIILVAIMASYLAFIDGVFYRVVQQILKSFSS